MECEKVIEAIVFDFDGVITQSNDVRRNAYYDMLSHVSGSKEVIEEAVIEDLKRNRYGIIEAALQKLRDRGLMHFQDLQQETERYVGIYNEITEREVSKAPEVPGAERSLMQLSRNYPLFVITGTLQRSLDIVMRNRNLVKYFKKAYGDFRDKVEGVSALLKEYGFNPKNIVFVGDGRADYECVLHHNMIFIAVLNETNDFEKREDIKWKLQNLERLPKMIGEIEKSFESS